MVHRLRVYRGRDVEVMYDERPCLHVAECERARAPLFRRAREPWCEPDRVTVDEAVEIVERCPTGALTYVRDDGAPEPATTENTVLVAHAGPLYLRGDLWIEDAPDDMPGVRRRAALCRCGASETKPFCDGRHETVAFLDAGAIGDGDADAAPEPGPLRISCAKDGPLRLEGPHTLVTGSGRVARRTRRSTLCRCGLSSSKPFCDGSHKAAGFRDDAGLR